MSNEVTIVGQYAISGFWGNYEIKVARVDYGNGPLYYPLTPCCDASGKGMDYEYGVGCRSCYQEVDPVFGGCWTSDEEFNTEVARGSLKPVG
jgi:hypothetical protein